ncbi:MAG TPA: hypothetical protein PKD18_18840 [Saprospiraceae bacterium]|nr:hypothetical protein [Saprospiraceae bacterium]
MKSRKQPDIPIENKLEKDYIKNLILNDPDLLADLHKSGIDPKLAFPDELNPRTPHYYCLGFTFPCATIYDYADVSDNGFIQANDIYAINKVILGVWDEQIAIDSGFIDIGVARYLSCIAICSSADTICDSLNTIDLLAIQYFQDDLVECY